MQGHIVLRAITLATALLTLPIAAQVRTGIDVLTDIDCSPLRDCKVGLITNHTGRTRDGRRTVDVLYAAKDVTLVTLFSPEHGWQGVVDKKVSDTVDEATGLKVFSLYGKARKPTTEMLQGIDTLVFDIQDIGCRFYTYVATMRKAIEAAAEHSIRFMVLDRPNPIGGIVMAGPILQTDRLDFVGAHTMPLRHGMTAGELARMIVGENGLKVSLEVIACSGWQRADLWQHTGLTWINPSPNIRRLTQALTYPGIGIIEGTNVSVGRGTDTPFEILGAPWCEGQKLAKLLNQAQLPGVAFVPAHFTPTSSKHKNTACEGIQILVTNWRKYEAVRTGIHIACALRTLFPIDWDTKRLDWLLKDKASCDAILAGIDPDEIISKWRRPLDLFRLRRGPFLLYE